jgi:hypothetical protein
MTMHIKFWKQHCYVYICIVLKQNLTLWRGFESRILGSVGGRDDHYATPPGLKKGF